MRLEHKSKNRQAAVLACLSLIPVILISLLIFGFSSKTGTQSGGTSEKIAAWLIDVFVKDYAGLPEEEQIELLETVHHWVRKFAHFSEFGALGFFALMHLNRVGVCFIKNGSYLFIRKKIPVERAKKVLIFQKAWLICWIYGTVYACADEIHQAFVPDRGPGVKDVIIDSAGVICGILLIMFIRFLILKAGSRKNTENDAG